MGQEKITATVRENEWTVYVPSDLADFVSNLFDECLQTEGEWDSNMSTRDFVMKALSKTYAESDPEVAAVIDGDKSVDVKCPWETQAKKAWKEMKKADLPTQGQVINYLSVLHPREIAEIATHMLDMLTAISGDWPLKDTIDCYRAPPALLAQMMMQALPLPDDGMTPADKAYWLQVSEALGPDWVPELKRAADFTKRVSDYV